MEVRVHGSAASRCPRQCTRRAPRDASALPFVWCDRPDFIGVNSACGVYPDKIGAVAPDKGERARVPGSPSCTLPGATARCRSMHPYLHLGLLNMPALDLLHAPGLSLSQYFL